MSQSIAQVSLLVRSYDEAIGFYVNKLGFTLIEDTPLPDAGKRWVVVAPAGGGCRLLLAEPSNAEQHAYIGNQCGDRVWLFLHTDNFWRDFEHYSEQGVRFLEQPREEVYGTVAVFEDLYGNRWDLLQPA